MRAFSGIREALPQCKLTNAARLNLEKELAECRDKVQDSERILRKWRSRTASTQRRFDAVRASYIQANSNLQHLHAEMHFQVAAKEATIQELNLHLKKLQRQLREYEAQSDTNERRFEQLQKDHQDAHKLIEEQRSSSVKTKDDLASLQREFSELQTRVHDFDKIEASKVNLEEQLTNLQSQHKQLQMDLSKLHQS